MKIIVTFDDILKPEKRTSWSLCYDLVAADSKVINPWKCKIIPLGIKTNFAWKLFIRSSLPLKKNLMLANSVWIIDDDYRDEAWAILYNFWSTSIEVKFWERIAQMEVLCWDNIEIIVDKDLFENRKILKKTDRKWWFGSTDWYL